MVSAETQNGKVQMVLKRITDFVGHLIPLVASIPPLQIWIGLMAIPFIWYIIFMASDIGTLP
ncbi:MAG: hypothetical protein K9W43_05850 [Candidatus Thorarchaeota archaeon]|nr:hypothetical protein [Candidatus Thorarchaeota archaeon]